MREFPPVYFMTDLTGFPLFTQGLQSPGILFSQAVRYTWILAQYLQGNYPPMPLRIFFHHNQLYKSLKVLAWTIFCNNCQELREYCENLHVAEKDVEEYKELLKDSETKCRKLREERTQSEKKNEWWQRRYHKSEQEKKRYISYFLKFWTPLIMDFFNLGTLKFWYILPKMLFRVLLL